MPARDVLGVPKVSAEEDAGDDEGGEVLARGYLEDEVASNSAGHTV